MKVLLSVLFVVLLAGLAFGQKTVSDEIELGKQFAKAGNVAAAIEAFTRAIEQDTTSAAPYFERGELLAKSQQCDKAIPDFSRAIEIDSIHYSAIVGRAFCFGATGKFDELIAETNRAIEIDPAKPHAYFTRGCGFYSKSRYDEALRDYNQAIELGMNTAEAYGKRAAARDMVDDWAGAIIDHTRAVNLDPGNWKRYAGRAIARRSYGDYLGAIEDYNKLLELAPEERVEIHNRSWAKLFNNDAAGAYQDTIDYLGKEGVSNPAAPMPVMVGYIALRKMGKDEAARNFVREALKHVKAGEWHTQILSFLAGDISPERFLELAKNDKYQLTDAHSLIGTKFLLDGDRKNAAVHFKWDQENGSHEMIFHQLARTEYARMTGNPQLLKPPRPLN